MNNIKLEQSANGYAVATVGPLTSFEGKAFVKEVMGTTSIELSFGTLAAGEQLPFFHHPTEKRHDKRRKNGRKN